MLSREKLEEFNEWWASGRVPAELAPFYRRELFRELNREMAKRMITAITGLRRVGKTTMMYQLVQSLLDEKVKAENILFFSFDEAVGELSDVIGVYREIHRKDFRLDRTYVFLDEVQKLPGWEDQIKKYYDLYPKIKFVLSGSESLFVRKGTKERLAGRISEHCLSTLSFKEFLDLKNAVVEERKSSTKMAPLLREYIEKGGFPETVDEPSLGEVRRYVRSIVIDKVVYKDIPTISRISDTGLLLILLETIATNPGMTIDYASLAQRLGRDRRVIQNYIFWLEQSFLVNLLINYRKGGLARLKKARRAYPSDNAVITAFKPTIDEAFFGRMVESAIINSIHAKFFWKNRHDIDALVGTTPLEVKFQPKILPEDMKGVRECMQKFGFRKGLIITKDEGRSIATPDGRIKLVPAWLFLQEPEKFA